jgi:chemotaxis signal transduction protein
MLMSTQMQELSERMKDVGRYRQMLNNLSGQWELLAILGQMTGTSADMGTTRSEFDALSGKLLEQLSQENLKKTVQQMTGKAQVAVDILIRNLFERTADIGFLATDAGVRDFLANPDATGMTDMLKARFREYVAKYSVYHNIILLDCDGKVLLQLDDASPVEKTTDPIVHEALVTSQEFVEAYRVSDLVPGTQPALIYSFRVGSGDDSDPSNKGVLCLCFRFEDELEGIFGNLATEDDWSVLSILDAKGHVIASSDPYQVPIGAKLHMVVNQDFEVVRFAGREYLSKTCPTKGYQGFKGLGWLGHVMVPLDKAFVTAQGVQLSDRIDAVILEAVMQDPQLFAEELRSIPVQADRIQEELDLTVWNGNVRQSTRESKVLLQSISATGVKTKEVFADSIGNLHETVVSTILEDVLFQASLAVDIMDRNLYERANDCRWWALTADFRRIMAKEQISDEDRTLARNILKYINDLYTVYSNLFLYDHSGRVIAVSNPSESRFVNTVVEKSWVHETLALSGTQAYSVSPFEQTALYGGRPTYIYGAVVTDLQKSTPCGGIGIVFDSEPQFRSMLQDSLPQDEQGKPLAGYLGFFINRDGSIISSTADEWKPGQTLKIPKEYLHTEEGPGQSGIIEFAGKFYAIGSRLSSGYREYKRGDGYKNEVIALAMAPLAASISTEKREEKTLTFDCSRVVSNAADAVEIATFYLGQRAMGVRTDAVRGAVSTDGLTPIPGAHRLLAGKVAYEGKAVPIVNFGILIGEEQARLQTQKIIVINSGRGAVGLLVDKLGPIPIIGREHIDMNASLLDRCDAFTAGVVMPAECGDHRQMLVIIDVDRLAAYLNSDDVFRVSQTNKTSTPSAVK